MLPSLGARNLFACTSLALSPGARWFCDGSRELLRAGRTATRSCKLVCVASVGGSEDGAGPGRRRACGCRGSFLAGRLRQGGLAQRKESLHLAGLNPLWLFPCDRVFDEVSLAGGTRGLQPAFSSLEILNHPSREGRVFASWERQEWRKQLGLFWKAFKPLLPSGEKAIL